MGSAHVDAGETTLTERLLLAAGVIDEVGSVDHGSTQTDSLALERQFGITIKSAVVSFVVGDVTDNLIDTPGHRTSSPGWSGCWTCSRRVLVVSAVEGVRARTRVLMRTLRRLGIPTLIFVNELDRGDAHGPVSGTVFKVERGPAGEKIACVRMFSGTVPATPTSARADRRHHRVVSRLEGAPGRRPASASRRRRIPAWAGRPPTSPT